MHVSPLFYVTFAVNFLALVLALWLGLYLVARNAGYPIAWLTALTLWCVAGLFLNILLALNPPPPAASWPAWLHFVFPFWPAESLGGEASAWLQGWSVIPAIAFWHHATTLMRSRKLHIWQWTRVLAGYVLAVIAIVVQTNTPILFTVESGNPLYLNSLGAGPWYPFFGIALLVLTIACVTNLVRTARASPAPITHRQLMILAGATSFAGLVGPLSLAGSAFQAPIPIVGLSLAVGIPVGLMGYGVARFSILMEGRTIRRDFLYNLALLTLVILVYVLASWILIQAYQAPTSLLVFIPVLAVLTHALMNPAFRLMDPLFYGRDTRQLRTILRGLVRTAGEEQILEENLGKALEGLCTLVRATYGLILVCEEDSVRQVAACRWRGEVTNLKPADISADDVRYLARGQLQAPLEDAVLLVPLYAEQGQLGALVLGRPVNGIHYASEEVIRLMNPADQIADAIYIAQLKARSLRKIVELAEAQPAPVIDWSALIPVEAVESALRNLYDYSFLADTALSELKLVDARLPQGAITHLDRGKIVHEVMLEAMEKLRPSNGTSQNPPPREWYPYLILRDAYVEERPNREIMLRLFISEGTFNRTRRSAIRSLARALGEMEVTDS
jgi:hypothetical protein